MPIVQLNFNNPLNVSVQIGDIAYFINPTNVGPDKEWADTHTPHITGGQGGIIEIGRIVNIFQWDGTTSYIQCDMDQLLFNRYFAQLQQGGCTTVEDVSNCNNEVDVFGEPACCNYIDSGAGTFDDFADINRWIFDNPTLNFWDYRYHHLINSSYSMCEPENQPPLAPPGQFVTCCVSQNNPNFNGSFTNVWDRADHINIVIDQNNIATPPNPFQGAHVFTATDGLLTGNDILTFLDNAYPGLYPLGMSWDDIMQLQPGDLWQCPGCPLTGAWVGFSNLGGTIPETTTCTQGSFIMFSKDNKVNMSSILGYYASVELRNNSLGKAELFNVGTSFFESSK